MTDVYINWPGYDLLTPEEQKDARSRLGAALDGPDDARLVFGVTEPLDPIRAKALEQAVLMLEEQPYPIAPQPEDRMVVAAQRFEKYLRTGG